jgi:hypothetical protein
MKIEVYDCTEKTDAATPEPQVTEEQLKIIEELGLEGQQSLVQKSEDAAAPSEICPYRQMTQEEFGVYSHLCPVKTAIKKFAAEAIPLRVLQVAAHAHSLGFFESLEVWHTKGASEIKDPVLVAKRKRDQFTTDFFILARWGEELEPLADLRVKAIKAARGNRVAALKKVKDRVERDINRIEHSVSDDTLLGWRETGPSYFENEY